MKLRLGTFNLFQFVAPPFMYYTRKGKYNQKQWIEKTTWITAQIRQMGCDVIGFQEVFSKEALEILVKELGFEYFATVEDAKRSDTTPNKYMSTTVAIASKYPITQLKSVDTHAPSLEKHHFQDAFAFSRLPIKATLALRNDQEVVVYVCHLKSNRLNEFEYVFKKGDTLTQKKERVSTILQGKSAKALKQRLCEASSLFFDMQASQETPTVLMCDLNDKEFSLTIDALTNPRYHDEASQKSLLLCDAHYHHTPQVDNPHPEQKNPQRKATSYFKSKGNVLDYIFLSKHFCKEQPHSIANITDYTVLDAHLVGNKDGSILTSDHAQVVCELTFH
jgi:endonuclease/exonuclease/phosphatase family metal-dependent hydrolase